MAGPTDPTSNLPQFAQYVAGNGVPYSNGQSAPNATPGVPFGTGTPVAVVAPVSRFVSRQATPLVIAAQPPAATPSTPAPQSPAGLTPAAQPAPANPVRPPADGTMIGTGVGLNAVQGLPNLGGADVLVSPTPGEGNPLPPNMRGSGGGVGLPVGGLPTLSPANAGGSYPEVIRGGVVTPGSADNSGGGYYPEVIRGGVVTPGSDDIGAGRGFTAPRGGGLADPQAVINAGFDTQGQRAQGYIDQALGYINQGTNIFDRATRARAIAGVFNATLGPNNVGQVQGAGQDALNSALGGVQQAGIGANASEFGSTLNYAGNAERVGEAHYEAATGSEPIGSTFVQTQFGPMSVTRYGSRAGGMAPSPISTSPEASSGGLRVGAPARESDGTYSAPGGRTVTVRGGRVTAIQ